MQLTKAEQAALEALESKQRSRSIPMMQDQQDMLDYLRMKKLHNHCTNPHCIGHHGQEHEVSCPNCSKQLFKLPN